MARKMRCVLPKSRRGSKTRKLPKGCHKVTKRVLKCHSKKKVGTSIGVNLTKIF